MASLIASFPHMLHSDSKGLSLTRQLLRSTHLFAPKIHNVLAVKVVCEPELVNQEFHMQNVELFYSKTGVTQKSDPVPLYLHCPKGKVSIKIAI